MGRKEGPLLGYYRRNTRFAELINGWVFDGEPVLKAEDLKDEDSRQLRQGGRGRKEFGTRYRDIYKRAGSFDLQLLIGAELQEAVDYAMPLRIMDMDALSYMEQRRNMADARRSQGGRPGGNEGEFLYQFAKTDRLCPLITLVLYLGEKVWDGPRSLHELLRLEEIPEKARRYVENYSIQVLDVRRTPDEQLRRFPPDICFMLMFIKYTNDKEALRNLASLSGRETVAEDTFETLADYAGEQRLLEWRKRKKDKEGEANMCKGIQDLIDEGKNEGKKEGKAEGDQRRLLLQVKRKVEKGRSLEEAAEELEETSENLRPLYEAVKAHPEAGEEELLQKLLKK